MTLAMTDTSLDTLCVNTIRTLAIDAVQQANVGPLGEVIGSSPRRARHWPGRAPGTDGRQRCRSA